MKKFICGLLLWNLLLTVAIGSCEYSLKKHLEIIVGTIGNVHDLAVITNKLNEQQEKIAKIMNVAYTYPSNDSQVHTAKGIIERGKVWNRVLTHKEIEAYRIKTMPEDLKEHISNKE